jgi:hypothetical protein
LSSQSGQFRGGIGEPALGARDLPFNGVEVAADASIGGITDQPETINAGFDIAQVLAKVMNQVDQDVFRGRKCR